MRKVLIVGDNVVSLLAFKKILDQRNYIIKEARNQDEAIDALKLEIFDVVLLDMKLPPAGWKTGFQILEKKKNIPLNTATPVIIISGEVQQNIIQQKVTEMDSVVEILEKPVEPDELLHAIDQVCGV